jgi:hypothetical protein
MIGIPFFSSERFLAKANFKTCERFVLRQVCEPQLRSPSCFGRVWDGGPGSRKDSVRESRQPVAPDSHLQPQRGEEEAAVGSERCRLDR